MRNEGALARGTLASAVMVAVLWGAPAGADPYPPLWEGGNDSGAVHHLPAAWPSEPPIAADCGHECGEWKPYTRFQNTLNDPRIADPSNGGTSPQNYVNIASSCIDKDLPSIYYNLKKVDEGDPSRDVIMFRWRVEQIANTYATGPNPGTYGATHPWNSALWTVLFDVDGSGYRDLAAHLNGSSGSPSTPIDLLAGIYGRIPTQSINYLDDPDNIKLLGHNPTAFIDGGSNRILNFQNSVTPLASWPNGSAETAWDYGTSRAIKVTTRSCTEYFVDYQIPVAMLDATVHGGPKVDRSTPIAMLFCTANSLNNPFQKDCALNRSWVADPNKPGPFGDYISFDQDEPYAQPIVREVTAEAPGTCDQDFALTAVVQDTLAVTDGVVHESVKEVSFWYYHDVDGDGVSNDGSAWTRVNALATLVPGSLNTWRAQWDGSSLPRGRYLVGVQAVDDSTLVDDDMTPTGIDNRTFSYVTSNALGEVYINGDTPEWKIASGDFPSHAPPMSPAASENWYGNPAITGLQVATAGVDLAVNACGVAPAVSKSVSRDNVAVGETVTYTVTIGNPANNTTISIEEVSDTLPDGFTYVNDSTSGDLGSANPSISGQTLTWVQNPAAGVAAGASASLSFDAVVSGDAGTYNNVARASIPGYGVIESDPATVVVAAARLSLSKTPSSYSASPGGQVTFRLSYANPSGATVTGVVLTDPLPANTSLGSCLPACSIDAGAVSWSLGTLAAGASGFVDLVLELDAAYSSSILNNVAGLSGQDPAGAQITATAESAIYVDVPVESIPAFTLEKTANQIRIAPGGVVAYTIHYSNYGGAAASAVTITDTLPAGMNYVAASCTGGSGCSVDGSTVTWSLGSVAAGASGSVSFSAIADDPFEAPNPAVNSAMINWSGGDGVGAEVSVGITGLSCSTYYFRDESRNVGFDGMQRVATADPVPVSGDAGSSVTVFAPNAGSAFLEAVRFYQDPATSVDTEFSGTVSTRLYIDRSNGPGLDLQATLLRHDSTTGGSVQLGQQVFAFGGNTKGLFEFAVPVAGTLAKEERLLWVFEVRSQHVNNGYNVQIQYNGTVSNSISGGTTFADSGANFCVTPPPNLTIDKVVDQATVTAGQSSPLQYSIRYGNTGSSTANSALVHDYLPADVSFVEASLNGTPIVPSGSNPHVFAIGDVPPGESGTLVIDALVNELAEGLLTNIARIESQQTSLVEDQASTLVGMPGDGGGAGTPRLAVSKLASAGLLDAGQSVTYTLTAVNVGSASATNVTVTDDFPQAGYFAYVDCSTSAGTCAESPAGVLEWLVGTIPAGEVVTLEYTMQAAASGLPAGVTERVNYALASDDDYCTQADVEGCTSNPVTVSLNGNPLLTLGKSATPVSGLAPGDEVEWTLTVANIGSAAASNVVVSDPIVAGTQFVTATAPGVFDAVGNRVVFVLPSLAAGASQNLSFVSRIGALAAGNDQLFTNVASAVAGNAARVESSAQIEASAAPELVVDKSGPASLPFPAGRVAVAVDSATALVLDSAALIEVQDHVQVGGSVVRVIALSGNTLTLSAPVTAAAGDEVRRAATFALSYRNDGNATATGVTLSDILPAGWVFASASDNPDGSVPDAPAVGANGTVIWALGSLPAGQGGSVQVSAIPTVAGVHDNTAVLGDAVYCTGILPATCSDTSQTAVGGVTVHKRTSTPVVSVHPAGAIAQYTITLTNTLAAPINGVEVTDLLPAGFSYRAGSAIPAPASVDADGNPTWNVDVPADAVLEISFEADVSADTGTATYDNEVLVSAPPGVGVTPFDALATTDEDVTVIGAGAYVIDGHVFHDVNQNGVLDADEGGFEGVRIEINDVAQNEPYVLYTDGFGYFRLILAEEPADWSVEITGGDNATVLAGYVLLEQYLPMPRIVPLGSPNPDSQSVLFGYAAEADVPVTLSGTVFHDNGTGVAGIARDGLLNGDEVGTNAGGLNVVVVDASDEVLAVASVAANGDWSASVAQGSGYLAYVSTASPAVGNTVTPSASVPAGWTVTGEGDATPDGQRTAIDATASLGGLDFGIALLVPDVYATIAMPAQVDAGGLLSALIRFGNQGDALAEGVSYQVSGLPTGLDGVDCAGASCEYNPASGVVTVTGLPSALSPQQSNVVQLGLIAPASGSVELTAVIATTTEDEAPTENNTASAATVIGDAQAEVTTAITAPASVAAGAEVHATALFVNIGSVDAVAVAYTLTGLDGAGLNPVVAHDGVPCVYDAAGGGVSACNLPDELAAGALLALDVAYTAPANGSVTVTSTIAAANDTNLANNTDSATTQVDAAATLADVTANVSVPATGTVGSEVHGVVHFGNLGPAAAEGVAYSLSGLPGGAVVSYGGAACTVAPVGGELSGCSLPATLTPGASIELALSYTPAATGSVTLDAVVGTTTDEVSTANNTATATTVIAAAPTYPVTYDGNGHSGGSVPVDGDSPYAAGTTVTVIGNAGGLVRTGHAFAGWNTAADGGGTGYSGGDEFAMPAASVTLYAQWTVLPGVPQGAVSLVKTAYLGHDAGAQCPGSKEVVYVSANPVPVALTWCFVLTNTGNERLDQPAFTDAGLGVTPGNQAGMVLRSGSLPLEPGESAVWYFEDARQLSLLNYASVSMTVVDQDGVPVPGTDPVYGEDSVPAIFGHVFDPPFGVKTGELLGQTVVRWTMVWVNDNVIAADGVLITDPPPEGTTMMGSPTCTPHGDTTVDVCAFDPPDATYPRGRVRVLANFGADFGVTLATIDSAPNRLEIAFDVLLDDPDVERSYENQGHAEWLPPGENEAFEALTYDRTQLEGLDPGLRPSQIDPAQVAPLESVVEVVGNLEPQSLTPIPVNGPLGLLLLMLAIGGLAWRQHWKHARGRRAT